MEHLDHGPESLTDRKRRLVRQRIVEAADELFAANGFDNVSVADIAAHAEVGRTTFFRYFGDKVEVVFAHEEDILSRITRFAESEAVGPATTAAEAVAQLRPLVIAVCDQASLDIKGYALHYELIEQHVELRARDALKAQRIADELARILIGRGTAGHKAVFAGQIALACYWTARRRATSPARLSAETAAAFDQLTNL
jgi:AcrR family transcriptional regulator